MRFFHSANNWATMWFHAFVCLFVARYSQSILLVYSFGKMNAFCKYLLSLLITRASFDKIAHNVQRLLVILSSRSNKTILDVIFLIFSHDIFVRCYFWFRCSSFVRRIFPWLNLYKPSQDYRKTNLTVDNVRRLSLTISGAYYQCSL